MTYALFIEKRVQRSLSRIAAQDRDRIVDAIGRLADEPRAHGVKKLSGRNAWGIRVGDYRVLYEIHDERLLEAFLYRTFAFRHSRASGNPVTD